MRKSYLAFLIILLMGIVSSASWYNNDWGFSRLISLNNPSNFTFINITDSANINNDFSDLRFVDVTNTTLFNHTLEFTNNGSQTWARIETKGNGRFFMYYGNTLATSISNVSKTYYLPTSFWNLDHNTNDQVGGITATVVGGVTSSTGYINGSYSFDGVAGSYLRTATNTLLEPPSTYTACAYIMTTDAGNFRTVLAKDFDGSDFALGIRQTNAGKVQSIVRTGVTTTYHVGSATLLNNTWVHYCARYNGTHIAGFINGTADGSPTAKTGAIAYGSSKNFSIGAWVQGATPTQEFSGKIDEVIFFRRNLSNEEIYSLWNTSATFYNLGGEIVKPVPTIVLISPTNGTETANHTVDFYLNVTDTMTLTNVSLYLNGVLNETNSSGLNANYTFTKTLGSGTYNWFITACNNDLCGNSSVRTVIVSNWVQSALYGPTSTTKGATEMFGLTLNLTTGISLTGANLVYNGSVFAVSIADLGNNQVNITKSMTIPNATGNISWYFNFTLSDSSTNQINTQYVTVLALAIDDCSSYTIRLYNFTVYDEKTLIKLNASTLFVNGSLNIQLYDSDESTLISNYSKNFINTNPFAVCIQNSLVATSNYTVNFQVKYSALGYVEEFYNVLGDTITASDLNTNISLYDLDNSSSQEFKITFRDASFLPVPNAVIQVQKKYIGEGLFRTVEQPITDSLGQTLAHLELSNSVYTFIVLINNEVRFTLTDQIAICQNPTFTDCEIFLNELNSNVQTTDYTNYNGVSFIMAYNRTTRTVSSVFSQTAGVPTLFSLNATFLDNFGNQSVCNGSVFSSSGTLSCTVPAGFGNSSLLVSLYSNGNHVGQSIISMSQDPRQIYGGARVGIAILMIISLIATSLIGIPVISAIFLIICLIALVSLNIIASTGIIGAGATALWLIVAVILVIVKGGNR